MGPIEVGPLALPAPQFGEFTFPFYRELLSGGDGSGQRIVAASLSAGGAPAGLCLTRLDPSSGAAEVLSLYVSTEHRGQGWGSRLLGEAVAALRAVGAREVSIVYICGDGTPALESTLRKGGWPEPRPRMILCKTDAAHFLKAPWIAEAQLKRGFSIFPWRDLKPETRSLIMGLEGKPHWHTAPLSPFKEGAFYEPETSLGLEFNGELAGWLVTHRVIPGSVRYTNLFVRKDLRWRAPHLPLIAEAVRRHMRSAFYATTPYAMFNQPVDDEVVHRFFVNRLKSYLTSVKESRGSCLSLQP